MGDEPNNYSVAATVGLRHYEHVGLEERSRLNDYVLWVWAPMPILLNTENLLWASETRLFIIIHNADRASHHDHHPCGEYVEGKSLLMVMITGCGEIPRLFLGDSSLGRSVDLDVEAPHI